MKILKDRFLMRCKLAWCAFWLIPIEVQYKPFHYYCNLKKGTDCDNSYEWRTKCNNKATKALAETTIKIEVEEGDFYHLCDSCTEKAIGSKYKI